MSNRISEDKLQLIAREYITNGLNKVKALLSAGYSNSYATSGIGLKLYDNARLKAIIADIQSKKQAKLEITADFIKYEHIRLAKLAESKGDITNATANIRDLGKSIALYSDNVINSNTNTVQDLSIDDIAELKRIASAATNIRLVSNHKTA